MYFSETQFERKWKDKFSEAAKKGGEDYQISLWTKEGLKNYIKYFFRYFSPYVKKDNSQALVLDLGCGPGTFSRLLAKKGFKVIGVDYSEKMINVAKGKSQGIDYRVANIYNLPFADKYFNIVICLGVFQCIKKPVEAIKEIKRVLKKDGLVVITTLNKFSLAKKRTFHQRYSPHWLRDEFQKEFCEVRLKGIYFVPYSFLADLIFRFRMYKFFNLFFPIFTYISHSFYLEGRKK